MLPFLALLSSSGPLEALVSPLCPLKNLLSSALLFLLMVFPFSLFAFPSFSTVSKYPKSFAGRADPFLLPTEGLPGITDTMTAA